MLHLDPTLDPLADAIYWKKKNPWAYDQIVRWALDCHFRDETPSMALFVELLRHPRFSQYWGLTRGNQKFLIPNALRSSLARLVMREHPMLRFRTSDSWAERGGKPKTERGAA